MLRRARETRERHGAIYTMAELDEAVTDHANALYILQVRNSALTVTDLKVYRALPGEMVASTIYNHHSDCRELRYSLVLSQAELCRRRI